MAVVRAARGLLLGLVLALMVAPAAAKGGEDDANGKRNDPWSWAAPKAKINYVDVSKAPEVKVYVSYLNRSLRPVDLAKTDLTVLRKPVDSPAVELVSFVKGELAAGKKKGDGDEEAEEEADEDLPEPTLTMLADEERGMAMVLVLPGTSDSAYKPEGFMGPANKTAAETLLTAGGNHRMNVLWVADEVWLWAQSTSAVELNPYGEVWPRCEQWALDQWEAPPPAEGEEDAPSPDAIHCGLTKEYGGLADVVAVTNDKGWYPHLFGLRSAPCQKPQFKRRSSDLGELDAEMFPSAPSAFDVALEMLVRDAEPGQPKAILLLGDGRDGYLKTMEECKAEFVTRCEDENAKPERERGSSYNSYYSVLRKWKKARKACLDKRLKTKAIAEQEKFRDRLETWLSIAKAANIRVYTVSNPLADPHERDRLEILALRTGGTFRMAADSNEYLAQVSDLSEELHQQYVITFHDPAAVPGAALSYEVELRSRGRTKTPLFAVGVPKLPTGFGVWVAGARQSMRDTLGPAGMIAIAVVVGLLLLLIVLKLGKKILGKGAKAAGGAAKKGAKGAKGAAKAAEGGGAAALGGARKVGKSLRKINK